MLIIYSLIVIPSWIDYFDKGKDTISLKELINNDSNIKSNNLLISGIGLFEHSCRFEELDDENKLKSVLWYIPFVTSEWKPNDTIKSILVLDTGKRSWDKDFNLAVKLLDKKVDSLSKINDKIEIFSKYKKYEVFKWENEAIRCLFSDKNLIYKNRWSLKKIEVNGKQSLSGKIIITIATSFFLILICYDLIKK